jgi:hypothetical protein
MLKQIGKFVREEIRKAIEPLKERIAELEMTGIKFVGSYQRAAEYHKRATRERKCSDGWAIQHQADRRWRKTTLQNRADLSGNFLPTWGELMPRLLGGNYQILGVNSQGRTAAVALQYIPCRECHTETY